jgi:hypothetical protein
MKRPAHISEETWEGLAEWEQQLLGEEDEASHVSTEELDGICAGLVGEENWKQTAPGIKFNMRNEVLKVVIVMQGRGWSK